MNPENMSLYAFVHIKQNLLPTFRSDCLKTVGSNGCRTQFLQSNQMVALLSQKVLMPGEGGGVALI